MRAPFSAPPPGRSESTEAQSSSLFAQFRDWRSRLSNADFSVLRERAHFRAPQQIDAQPELVLNLFEFVARHGVRPSHEAEQQIAAPPAADPRTRRRTWPALARILSLPHAPLAVRWMHETGVLTAIFPELEDIECLVVRDFYHRYTVDEHTLVAMENLWNAPAPFRELLTEIEQPGRAAASRCCSTMSGKGCRRSARGGRHRARRGRRWSASRCRSLIARRSSS